MDKAIETLVNIKRTEFDGPSPMGKPFLPYVRSLPLDIAKSNVSYEGYSVWGIVLHVLYNKWATIPLLGGKPRSELYPYEQADWPKPDPAQDEAANRKLAFESPVRSGAGPEERVDRRARYGHNARTEKAADGPCRALAQHDFLHPALRRARLGIPRLAPEA
jgi:hypothetical protein